MYSKDYVDVDVLLGNNSVAFKKRPRLRDALLCFREEFQQPTDPLIPFSKSLISAELLIDIWTSTDVHSMFIPQNLKSKVEISPSKLARNLMFKCFAKASGKCPAIEFLLQFHLHRFAAVVSVVSLRSAARNAMWSTGGACRINQNHDVRWCPRVKKCWETMANPGSSANCSCQGVWQANQKCPWQWLALDTWAEFAPWHTQRPYLNPLPTFVFFFCLFWLGTPSGSCMRMEIDEKTWGKYGDGSKPYPPVVHIKIAGIYGCSSP